MKINIQTKKNLPNSASKVPACNDERSKQSVLLKGASKFGSSSSCPKKYFTTPFPCFWIVESVQSTMKFGSTSTTQNFILTNFFSFELVRHVYHYRVLIYYAKQPLQKIRQKDALHEKMKWNFNSVNMRRHLISLFSSAEWSIRYLIHAIDIMLKMLNRQCVLNRKIWVWFCFIVIFKICFIFICFNFTSNNKYVHLSI